MTFTATDLQNQLKLDGNLFEGETDSDYDTIVDLLWHELQPNEGTLDVLGIGEFRIVDSAFGKSGPVLNGYESYGTTVWENYIVLERDGRFFKLSGSYNSWDSDPWDGEVVEVSKKIVEKVVWK